jgi:predicted ArsR family transcriptional regulator
MPDSSIVLPATASAGIRVLRSLIGQPPKTVCELMSELAVTRTAVSTQLELLLRLGMVEQKMEYLNTPGRPKHRYTATEKAVLLIHGGLQSRLLPAVMRTLEKYVDEETYEKIAVDVTKQVVAPWLEGINATDPKERLNEFVKLQTQSGVRLIELVEHSDGSVDIVRYNCPFGSMMNDKRMLCRMDLLGLKMVICGNNGRCCGEIIQNRHDGNPCCIIRCRFRRAPSSGEKSQTGVPVEVQKI